MFFYLQPCDVHSDQVVNHTSSYSIRHFIELIAMLNHDQLAIHQDHQNNDDGSNGIFRICCDILLIFGPMLIISIKSLAPKVSKISSNLKHLRSKPV